MKIALGADHNGYLLKDHIKKHFNNNNIQFTDYGTFKMDTSDYPEHSYKAAKAVAEGECNLGILISKTGIGMCVAANKLKGIRAATVNNLEIAQLSRLHFDINMLCLGADLTEEEDAIKIIQTVLKTSFEGGKYQKQLNLISQLTGL